MPPFPDVRTVPPVVFLVLVATLDARGISESRRSDLVMTIIGVSGLVVVVVTVAVLVGRGGDVGRALPDDRSSWAR